MAWGKKSKYTEAEKLAFRMGQVKAGLANKDSRVFESYENGQKSTEKKEQKPRKTLF